MTTFVHFADRGPDILRAKLANLSAHQTLYHRLLR